MLLAHKGRFERLGQRRLSGNRGLSVRLGTQTIFSTAKIKLGEGAGQRAALPHCSTRQDFFTPHIRHSMVKWKKGRKGGSAWNNELSVWVKKPKWHVRDMKGAKLTSVHIETNGYIQDSTTKSAVWTYSYAQMQAHIHQHRTASTFAPLYLT